MDDAVNFSELIVGGTHHGLHPRQVADVCRPEHDPPPGGFDFFDAADHPNDAIVVF